jgi:hypothetical protein
MSKENEAEDLDQELAHAVLGKFLGGDADAVMDIFDLEIKDPVVAAAVAIRVCEELDTTQISEFLAMLEEEPEGDDDGDGAPDDDGDPEPGKN